MTEKNIFAYKLFLSLNISDFNIFFMWKLKPPWKKSPPLKVEVLSAPSLFENLIGGSTTPCRKRGVHTMLCILFLWQLIFFFFDFYFDLQSMKYNTIKNDATKPKRICNIFEGWHCRFFICFTLHPSHILE